MHHVRPPFLCKLSVLPAGLCCGWEHRVVLVRNEPLPFGGQYIRGTVPMVGIRQPSPGAHFRGKVSSLRFWSTYTDVVAIGSMTLVSLLCLRGWERIGARVGGSRSVPSYCVEDSTGWR
jgi:hypothetical protein